MCGEGVGGPGAWRGAAAEPPPPSLAELLRPVTLRTAEPLHGTERLSEPSCHRAEQTVLRELGVRNPFRGRRRARRARLGSPEGATSAQAGRACLTGACTGCRRKQGTWLSGVPVRGGRGTASRGPPGSRTGHVPRTKQQQRKVCVIRVSGLGRCPTPTRTFSLATSEREAEGGLESRPHS